MTLNATTDYVVSAYVKANSITNTNTKFRVYEFDSSTMLTSILISSQLVVGEWVRIEIPFTSILGGNTAVRLMEDMAIGDSALVWGAQVEALPYATSYIPTNGSTVTRAGETCVDATPTINSEEGVLYFEGSTLVSSEGLNKMVTLNSGDASAYIQLLWFGTKDSLRVAFNGTPAGFSTKTINSIGQDNNNKIAVRYSSNGASIFINGSNVGELVGDFSFPTGTLTELDFDNGGGSFIFYGNTKDLRVYTEALTDDELITLTTI